MTTGTVGSAPITPRQVPQALWRTAVWPPVAGGAVFVLLGWANVISYFLFHYDLVARRPVAGHDFDASTGSVYCVLAGVLTVAGALGVWWIVNRQLYLVRYGREVVGRVAGLAAECYEGMRKAVVEYEVEGTRYEHATSTGVPLDDSFQAGDPVRVFVHPYKPGRSMVVWEKPAGR